MFVWVSVSIEKLWQTALPPRWLVPSMQASIQTHINMPSSWPQGRCNCLAHNSDWLEYQWREVNPKQLLTRDIKQSGESSHGDLMMPPGKHVLARIEALFNTITSKQLTTQSERWEEGYAVSPHSQTRGKPRGRSLSPVTKQQRADLCYHSSMIQISSFILTAFGWLIFFTGPSTLTAAVGMWLFGNKSLTKPNFYCLDVFDLPYHAALTEETH